MLSLAILIDIKLTIHIIIPNYKKIIIIMHHLS